MRTIVYSIDTIPDLDFGKKHMNLDGLSDEDIGRSMFFQQLQTKGDEFLPIDLHKIITISCVVEESGTVELKSFTALNNFITFVNDADYFITWNGKQFDFPVLYFRSLVERIVINKKIFTSIILPQYPYSLMFSFWIQLQYNFMGYRVLMILRKWKYNR